MEPTRTPLTITLSVWKALFLREAVQRLFSSRSAWVWLLFEPVAHIVFLMFVMTVIRLRTVGGIDTPVWILVGLLAFFMFRRPAGQGMSAVTANQALFSYRQVKPVDTVLARVCLEGFLMLVIAIILFMGSGLFGLAIMPADPLAVLEAFFGLWLIGLGFGLVTSVASTIVPELGKTILLLMTPLYFLSGVIFPLSKVPLPYREWLMFNPLAQGIEATRLAFAPHYQAVPELDISYVFKFAVIIIFLGLALHVRYSLRLATK